MPNGCSYDEPEAPAVDVKEHGLPMTQDMMRALLREETPKTETRRIPSRAYCRCGSTSFRNLDWGNPDAIRAERVGGVNYLHVPGPDGTFHRVFPRWQRRYVLEAAEPFLVSYYSQDAFRGQEAREPLHTVTSKPRFGVVMVHGEPYQIMDIGMRMLSPRELFRAQGFGDDYVIDVEVDGKTISKAAQVRCAGNSVCPDMGEALVTANTTMEATC